MSAISGVTNADVKAVMTAPKAAPMMTATASLTTFPRMTKSRNSLSTAGSLPRGYARASYGRGGHPPLPRRGPEGVAQQVRVGRSPAGDQARALPVLLRRVSDGLRLHPGDPEREGLGAGRDGVRVGTDLP